MVGLASNEGENPAKSRERYEILFLWRSQGSVCKTNYLIEKDDMEKGKDTTSITPHAYILYHQPHSYISFTRQEEEMESEVDECGLGLAAADAKPRLKWTRQLHQRFLNAVSQLGGPDKATPKSVMRVMGIPGITLYHLKSHLQKYRLAKKRDHKANNKTEDYRPTASVIPCIDENGTQTKFQDSRTTLQFQIEVQKKLQEQLEVQKHLQLRIEAQGKYLQSVLRKAQEALASYSLDCVDMEAANFEISELVSAADTAGCPSSPFPPAATCIVSKQFLSADRSTDSCLTSAEGPEQRNVKQNNSLETSESSDSWSAESNEMIFLGGKNVTSMHQIEIDLNR